VNTGPHFVHDRPRVGVADLAEATVVTTKTAMSPTVRTARLI
jgi:hypothetical protein